MAGLRGKTGSLVKLILQLTPRVSLLCPSPCPRVPAFGSSTRPCVPHSRHPTGVRAGPHTGRLSHVRKAAAQPRQAGDAARGGGPAARLPEPGVPVSGNAAGSRAVRGTHPPNPHSARPRCAAGLSLQPEPGRGRLRGATLKASGSHLRQPRW